MPTTSSPYSELGELFFRPVSLGPVLNGYHRIDQFAGVGELSRKEAFELKAYAFRAMQDTTADDPATAKRLILEHLLPHCLLRVPDDDDDQVHISRSRYRECLRDWLEELAESTRSSLRDEVLDRLCQSLAGPDPDLACGTIGVIGYRNEGVVEALWAAVEQCDDESGDVALATLSALGVPRAERPRLLSALCDRAGSRCNLPLVGALRRMADPASLDAVARSWLRPGDESFWPRYAFLIVHVLSDIAEAAADQSEVQDRVWDLIIDLHHADPERIGGMLYVGGAIASRCDSPRVIPDMLRELTVASDGTEKPQVRRDQLYSRMKDCVHPRQLEGWLSPLGIEAQEIIRGDAIRDTRSSGMYRTVAMNLKGSAWNTLLSLGEATLPTSAAFEEAVATETSPLVRMRISELLACFRLDRPPPTAVRWVTERRDIDREDAAHELTFRPAAARVLRSAATREAFEVLLAFGFTINGSALLQSLDAVSDVALKLAGDGDARVVDDLVEVLERGIERNNRVAAAEALIHLAAGEFLRPHHGSRLAEALQDETRDVHERSRIVEALGYLPRGVVTPDVERQLVLWAGGRDQVAWRSLGTLARQGRLLDHPELLTDRLGLRPVGDRWDLDPESKDAESSAPILVLLYVEHPEPFVDAVRACLRTKDWVYVARLAHVLDQLHRREGVLPSQVTDALIERIRLRQTRTAAETELFRLLARWDPDALARQPWQQYWDDWLPDARVALADALGETEFPGEATRDRAVAQVLALTKDGRYAVRRSAYRALSRLSGSSLSALCGMSAISSSSRDIPPPALELRRRGAEACAWLPSDTTFSTLHEHFANDPERSVRETARRMRAERRKRGDAERCLTAVLGVSDGSTSEILSAWRYGRALMLTGDDSCLRAIRDHVASRPLPPNVRHWLEQIAEGIEEGWRKVTQKWPEPWFYWTGAIEEGQGTLIFAGKDEVAVRYSLWKQPELTTSLLLSWGGAAWTPDGFMPFVLGPHDATLILANGSRGTILITRMSSDQVVFSGQGPDPS